MSSLFSKIVKREIPAYIVAENEDCLAFLDIMPLVKGHVLVIPKQEIDYIFDIENELLGKLMAFSKEVAVKIKKAFPCEKVGVSVVGLEVPHAHIHLIPINKVSDMNFSKEKLTLTPQELQAIADKIVGA